MSSSNSDVPARNSRATRSSLACLPCRARHLKCDGKKPECTRCAEATRVCLYARSRRGGLDRAALAERRQRLAAAEDLPSLGSVEPTLVKIPQPQALVGQNSEPLLLSPGFTIPDDPSILGGFSVGEGFSRPTPPTSPQVHVQDIENDALVNLYYKDFHRFHPFILPKRHLIKLCQDPAREASFKPLVAVVRFIGHIYDSKQWSASFKDFVELCFLQASPNDPVMVQCRLLYSIALFWHGYKEDSKREMNAAVQLALRLGMPRQEFAIENGCQDPVLVECWRRTWWMLFIVDAFYAGTLGAMNFATLDVEATVELPCEESEYESGEIPEPKTLEEFECREFASDDTSFSSFAYLIGAVRCAALAISIAPKVAVKEASTQVIEAADSVVDAWLLLLPKDDKQVISKTGIIDELMFQAHLVIHVATIGLHRPLSDLRFNAIESVSSCARDPPADSPTPDLINVHTIRVLRSVEAQIRLLALPARPFNHTPFITCMVSEGTLALLSACNFLHKGKELAIARDQIRMTIGCLKALGEVWPRTARNVREIQMIARHVLGLGPKSTKSNTPQSTGVPSLSGGEGQETLGSDGGQLSSDDDILASLANMDTVCGWYSSSDFATDMSWWTGQ
ncbi:hypothetical protein NW759_012678 [Fusarium solani]|uniref:Zn(2)-C6 fungal-type domain-containing protein n=1 Tax=Fusarium solani TaxID=169388 RepID=A0A9P9HCD3_FUSSL|nr:uncharacterized protein B0J15DRAFT_495073 [Fusarium solani]KAH7255025.1 hypothetical protein B0J15DRAFT_495073 [Fusarium solani]KAJ4211198.1 hypothetical protein NW759_012678 [Fusarium solani]